MKCGALAYATYQGLGVLAKSFVDAGVVNRVFRVEHPHHENQDWYAGAPSAPIHALGLPRVRIQLGEWVRELDVLLCFETPFDWTLIDFARRAGVKTVLMVMHECTPARMPAVPDELWCPSLLDLREFGNTTDHPGPAVAFAEDYRVNNTTTGVRYTPAPVAVEWRERTRAEVFVHNAGWGGLKGRNGTAESVNALRFIKSRADFLIRSQKPFDGHGGIKFTPGGGTVSWEFGTVPHDKLWTEGDVFVFPEKFNGLSLPLQEARAAGMLVMATDRFPNNTYLPREVESRDYDESFPPLVISERVWRNPLIPVAETRRNRIGPPYREFDEAVTDPRAIAAKIDEWYGRDITDYSRAGREWAKTMSWDALRPGYVKLLEDLVNR